MAREEKKKKNPRKKKQRNCVEEGGSVEDGTRDRQKMAVKSSRL